MRLLSFPIADLMAGWAPPTERKEAWLSSVYTSFVKLSDVAQLLECLLETGVWARDRLTK